MLFCKYLSFDLRCKTLEGFHFFSPVVTKSYSYVVPPPAHPFPTPRSNKKSLKVHPFKGRWEKDQNIKRSWLTFADRCHHALALALPRFSPANNPCSALVPAREFNQERWPKTIFSLEILCRPLSSTLLAEKRISIERFSRLFGREFQNKLLKIEAVLKYRGEQKNPLKHILLAMCMQGSLFQAGCYWQILSVNNSNAYCICQGIHAKSGRYLRYISAIFFGFSAKF